MVAMKMDNNDGSYILYVYVLVRLCLFSQWIQKMLLLLRFHNLSVTTRKQPPNNFFLFLQRQPVAHCCYICYSILVWQHQQPQQFSFYFGPIHTKNHCLSSRIHLYINIMYSFCPGFLGEIILYACVLRDIITLQNTYIHIHTVCVCVCTTV